MRPAETIATLAGFDGRGAGTDSERRAAQWLRRALKTPRSDAHLEAFWCRPSWALAHAWHVALAIAGSLVAESQPRVGGALIIVALVSLVADAATGLSLGRRLTPERASQNVVAEHAGSDAVHLIVTANYDAGRAGLVYRQRPRAAARTLARFGAGAAPGWLAWLAIACLWLIAIAALRVEGHRGTVIGIAQLIPTVGLVLALALLLELASASFGTGANDNASGVAAAIALARALDAAPPRNLVVDLVLQGAGDGGAIGLRHHLRSRRDALRAPTAVVLGFAPSGVGTVHWLDSDGPLVRLSYFRELRRMCEAVARDDPGLGARGRRGRGQSPAFPARQRRLPAIALGSDGGVARTEDDPQRVTPRAVDQTVEFGLMLVDAIDAFVGRRAATPIPA